MKRKNNKLLTLMLAGLICAATAGTVAATLPVNASADTTGKLYSLTDVFKNNNTAASVAGKDGKTALTIGNGQSIEYDRNLALQWFTAEGAHYTTLGFKFEDLNFTELEFKFEAIALHAAKDDTAVNSVKFVNADNKITVKVLNGEQENKVTEYEAGAIGAGSIITLSFAEGSEIGNYAVNLQVGEAAAEAIGEFTNIGAKYFANETITGTSKTAQSMVISAKTGTQPTVLYVNEINGQSFDGVSSDNKVEDKAAPVLVVNEDISNFLLGSQFELSYKVIDVLYSGTTDSQTVNKKTFYQYNPADETVELADNGIDYKTTIINNSTTGTYFMDTVVYWNETTGEYSKVAGEGFTKTTVYRLFGEEYASIRFSVKDETFTGDKVESYDLAWYAAPEAVKTLTVGKGDKAKTIDYIVLNRTENGPQYKAWTNADIEDYEAKLADKIAKDKLSAGSNSDLALPSLSWLIEDVNDAYSTLQFTISYKKPSSTSPATTSNVDPKSMKISVTEAGVYVFKVFANDVAGNAMMVEDENGDLVKVTASNVWDLDKIPSFEFKIEGETLRIKEGEDSDTLTSKILDETFTLGSISVVGASDQVSSYALYKLDISKYDGTGDLTTEKLSAVKYDKLQAEMKALIQAKLDAGETVSSLNFKEINKQAYINLVANLVGGETERAAVAKIFTLEIEEYNDKIEAETEAWDNSHNKYNWNADSASFTAVESGVYLIIADYWDNNSIYVNHAPAYHLVTVEPAVDFVDDGEKSDILSDLMAGCQATLDVSMIGVTLLAAGFALIKGKKEDN